MTVKMKGTTGGSSPTEPDGGNRSSNHNTSSSTTAAGPFPDRHTHSDISVYNTKGNNATDSVLRSRKSFQKSAANLDANSLSDQSAKTSDTRPSKLGILMENLSQQKLKAWQPILKPTCVAAIFIVSGVFFIGCGILLLLINKSVAQCEISYEDPDRACNDPAACTKFITRNIEANDCVGLNADATIAPPIFVYYRLTNFYQNHRRYAKSRSDAQLNGDVITEKAGLASCDPLIEESKTRLLLSPCGLIAASVFNDSYVFSKDGSGSISMDESAEAIAWEVDIKRFKNPSPPADPTIVKEWLSETLFPGRVTNAHFIVWMRIAALPDFRKLYGRINSEIKLPVTVTIGSRYPTAAYDGKKYISLSQTSFLGGRNLFLGIAYEVLGSCCLLFGFVLIIKNYQKPRLMGDVRHLNRIFNRADTARK